MSCHLSSLEKKKPHLALLDSTRRDAISYQSFIDSTQAAHFTIDYVSFDDIVDQKNINSTFSEKYEDVLGKLRQ